MARIKTPLAIVFGSALLGACETSERLEGPNWAGPAATPRGKEFTPEAAAQRNVAGWVMLLCVAGPGLTAQDCRIIAETPTGWGFGAAALRTREGLKITSASSFPGQHLPAPGELFQIPILFCPPSDPGCPARLHQVADEFREKASAARRLARAGDCQGAVKSAEAMNQPAFTAYLSASCRQAR